MKGFRGPVRTLRLVLLVCATTAVGWSGAADAQFFRGPLRGGEPPDLPGGNGGSSTGTGTTQNLPPSISGAPANHASVGSYYSFLPSAADPDGDALTFSVANLPAWAQFNPSSGAITGRPTANDVGLYAYISVAVSDGKTRQTLPPFSIQVDASSAAAVSLNWLPPTENEDGSALVDLAGYRIFYGQSASSLTRSVSIDNPGITAYVIENLTPGTWYFVARAYRSSGIESSDSPMIARVAR